MSWRWVLQRDPLRVLSGSWDRVRPVRRENGRPSARMHCGNLCISTACVGGVGGDFPTFSCPRVSRRFGDRQETGGIP